MRGVFLGIVCCGTLAIGVPFGAHAETWDFLFEDLSWPSEADPVSAGFGGSIDSFAEAGMTTGFSSNGFWEFLIPEIEWPDDLLSIDGGFSNE